MVDPVQAVPPVNTTVTIRPVTTTAPNQDAPNQNPLSSYANGTTVAGFVVNRDANNNPILRTPIGDLQVASDIFLKTGSEVIIKVDTSVPSLARILTVDGLSPQVYNAQSTRGLTQDTISAHITQPLLNIGTAQPANPNLPVGAPILQAIILQAQQPPATPLLTTALANAQSGPANVLAQLSLLSAGTPLRLALLDIKLPPVPVSLGTVPESTALDSFLPPKPAAGQAQQTIRQTEGQPQAGGYKPAIGQQPANPLTQEIAAPELFAAIEKEIKPLQAAAQQVLMARLEKESPEALLAKSLQQSDKSSQETPRTLTTQQSPLQVLPRTPAAQPQLNQPTLPNQLVANVIGHDADGANILMTPFATLKVYTPQPLPTGTTLLVQADIQSAQATQPATGTATNPATPLTPVQSIVQRLTGELSAFSDGINWFAANQPDIAREMQGKLPGLTSNLASNMLAYIAGIKSGDVADIIGKRAVRMLEANAPDILSRLRQCVSQMQVNYIESPLQHWSIVPLPIWLGQELQQLQMYIGKEPPENKDNPNKNHGQRFVLEVGLSELGDVQFDGFVRDRTPAKSFDLMVRTAATLPVDVSQGIRAIFENAMQVTGMQGQVVFQHGRQHFVKPLAEAPGATFGDGANTILA